MDRNSSQENANLLQKAAAADQLIRDLALKAELDSNLEEEKRVIIFEKKHSEELKRNAALKAEKASLTTELEALKNANH